MHTPEASSNHQQQTNSTAWKLPAWEKMIEICNSNRNPLSVSNHVPKCTVFPKKKQDRINHQSFYLSSHFLYIDVYCISCWQVLETCHAMSRLSSPSRAFLHLLQPLHGGHSAHIHQRVLTRQFLDRTPRATQKTSQFGKTSYICNKS